MRVLFGAGRPHDGAELAIRDGEGDALEHLQIHHARLVRLGNVRNSIVILSPNARGPVIGRQSGIPPV